MSQLDKKLEWTQCGHGHNVMFWRQSDRFEAEKTRIVSILEAGFAQRERLAVEKARAEAEAEGRAEVERALREQQEEVANKIKVGEGHS